VNIRTITRVLKKYTKRKSPIDFFKKIGLGRPEDQGPKPQGPSGHLGTKCLALPDDRRRPPVIGDVGAERVQAELAIRVIPAEDERNVRPVGAILPLKARQVRVVVQLPVPGQTRLRSEHQVLEYFDAGESNLIGSSCLERCFGTESRVGVRVEMDETKCTRRLHARRVAKLRVLDVVVLGVAVRWREGSEELVHDRLGIAVAEATSDQRLIAVGHGVEGIGLLQDVLPLLVADGDTECLPGVELLLDAFDARIDTRGELPLDHALESTADIAEITCAIAGNTVDLC